MPQICDMGQTAFFPSKGRRAEDFFALTNPTASARFEPANLYTKGQHATSLSLSLSLYIYVYIYIYIYIYLKSKMIKVIHEKDKG